MADEPRRSVRATKGQHTKMDMLDQLAEMKKKGAKKGSKKQVAQEEEDGDEVEVIRCICGALETSDDDDEPWIACDKCHVWQHNICVGVSTFDDEVPENYMCEQCDPVFHKPLLDAISRGEKPWEDNRRAFEQRKREEEEEEASKKKGKKGKGKRTSDPKSDLSQVSNGKAKSPSTPVPEPKKEKKEPVRAGSSKRKSAHESHDESSKEPQPKVRKVTHPTPKSPKSGLASKIIDLESDRQGGAKLIHKALLASIPEAVKTNVYAYGTGDTLETTSERLAIQVEDAVYQTHPDKNSYSKQARALFNNIKHNQELCNGLLTKSLSPSHLAVMTTDDMASKELKRETAEMKARSDKQAIMVTEDGPRVRRTHKGDEVIEGDGFAIPTETTTSTTSRRRFSSDPNTEISPQSQEGSPVGDEVELPDDIDNYRSRNDIRAHTIPKQPLSIETKNQNQPRKQSSHGDFDINKVFSSVQQSPTGGPPSHIRRPSINAPPAGGPGVDPEIDKLLADEDGNESPPYSPAEYDSDPSIVWRGMVIMDSIAKFPATAKHVGGADLTRSSSPMPWSDILQKELRVAGRIDQEKANEYLCSLRYSPPTDVVIVSVTATGEAASKGFQEMFDYFHSKSRYGVLTNKGVGNIRDTYLVPIAPSPASLPDFIINLEGHKLSESRPEPIIVVALVIRNEWQPDHHKSFDAAADGQSPLQSLPRRQMSISGTGPQMSPIASQTPTFTAGASSQSPHQPPQLAPEDLQRRQQQKDDQRQGEETAALILGEFVNAPTVGFLMPQAFQMRALEWEVIRGILEHDERARSDLQHLSQVLEIRMAQQPPGPSAPLPS